MSNNNPKEVLCLKLKTGFSITFAITFGNILTALFSETTSNVTKGGQLF